MLVMYQADATIVNVATPSIRGDLGASGAELELVISGYLLASATVLITGARLGHMRGYRSMFRAGRRVLPACSRSAASDLGPPFSSMLVHLTAAATPRYAADISGVFTTVMQIAGAISVAALGTLYMSQLTDSTAATASDAVGVVTAAFAVVAVIAGATAYRATHTPARCAGAAATART